VTEEYLLKTAKPKESQYQIQFDTLLEKGPVNLGPTASHRWRSDPRLFLFSLARYKFCAKMLSGKSRVLEVGCGDGFGMGILLQEVDSIHGVDMDPLFIEAAMRNSERENWNCSFQVLDITRARPEGLFGAAYSLDVIEHILPEHETAYMQAICSVIEPHGVVILGTPNVTSQQHASEWSKQGHVNLKSCEGLRALMLSYFHSVFIFSMNDEVVHTGYAPMAHYLLAMGVCPRESAQP